MFALTMKTLIILVASLRVGAFNSSTCNNRGVMITEEVSLFSRPAYCVCFECFTGRLCEDMLENCTVTASVATLALNLDWWLDHNEEMQVHESAAYHMGEYCFNCSIVQDLENVIRDLHNAVGNAKTDGYSVVTGVGASQLILAAYYALAQTYPNLSYVHARAPYYESLRQKAPLIRNLSWSDSTSLSPEEVIEVVTVPNNPDGKHYIAEYSQAKLIYDLVYYWPSMVPSVEKRSEAVMLFSLAKLTGYAATRVGWALVRDAAFAKLMNEYVLQMGQGPSVESQLRAAKALQAVRRSMGTHQDFFAIGSLRWNQRWRQVQEIFDDQDGFSLAETVPGAVFAWIRCAPSVLAQHGACYLAFESVGITATDGKIMAPASGLSYARICLGQNDPVFTLLLQRLRLLLHSANFEKAIV